MRPNAPASRETAIPPIAISCGHLNDRDGQLQETTGAPVLVSKCDRDRRIGAAIVTTKGANECAIAELKNNVVGSGFPEVLVRSDNEPAVMALKESATTASKLAGVTVLTERVLCATRRATGWQRAL